MHDNINKDPCKSSKCRKNKQINTTTTTTKNSNNKTKDKA
jgi:hypothetical protein